MKKDKGAVVMSVSGSQTISFIIKHWANNGQKLNRAISDEIAINGRKTIIARIESPTEKRNIIFITDNSEDDIRDTVRLMNIREHPVIIIGTFKHIGPYLSEAPTSSRYRELNRKLIGFSDVKGGRGILIKNNEKDYLYRKTPSDFGYKFVKELASFIWTIEKNILLYEELSANRSSLKKIARSRYRQGYALR